MSRCWPPADEAPRPDPFPGEFRIRRDIVRVRRAVEDAECRVVVLELEHEPSV